MLTFWCLSVQVQLQMLQDESESEVERLESLLASINAEHMAVVTELESVAPAGMRSTVCPHVLLLCFG